MEYFLIIFLILVSVAIVRQSIKDSSVKSYRVTIRIRDGLTFKDLHLEDKHEFPSLKSCVSHISYYRGKCEDEALAQFHMDRPIKVLDDFDIDAEEVR